MNADEVKKQQEKALKRAELEKLEPITFDELERVIRKWMIVPDRGVIKALVAYYITNRFARKAVWLTFVAPSGGGKTELLNGLLYLPDIYPLSTVTPNTFLSGMPGRGDASLLPKINGKILLLKDLTTILSMQRDARAEVFSQLREIWDGSMKKPFGNGKIASWEGKVSILAGSTQAVDMSQQMYTHLGERFLYYRIIMPDRKEVAMRCLDNDTDQELMTWEIQKSFYAFFKGLDLDKKREFEKLPPAVKSELVGLANFATMARSGVIRDTGMKKEVIFVPSAEMPTRIVQQLNSMISGCMVANGDKYDERDMDIIYKIALDSIPQTNRMVILEMAKGDEQKTAEIATALGYPTEPIRIYLENLALLGVCSRIKGQDSSAGGTADRWTMRQEFTEIIRKYEKVEQLTKEEITKRVEASLTPEEEGDRELDEYVATAKA